MTRAIMASKTYQLTSRSTHKSQNDPHLFARMPVKGLSAEQLFDSLAMATGYVESNPGNPRGVVVVGRGGGSARDQFLTKFANPTDKPTEASTSILQALALMNGKFIADATSVEQSWTLFVAAHAPIYKSTAERIEVLYLA